MKRGKEIRSAKGQPIEPRPTNEVMALMFVLVEQAPGAFSLRFVSNDELLEELQSQGTLQSFLDDVDRLYSDFRKTFGNIPTPVRSN